MLLKNQTGGDIAHDFRLQVAIHEQVPLAFAVVRIKGIAPLLKGDHAQPASGGAGGPNGSG